MPKRKVKGKRKKGGASLGPFVTGLRENMSVNLYLDNLEHQVLLKINVYLKSPLSGSENPYDPDAWNQDKIRTNNNCYSYAVSTRIIDRNGKPQPGYFSHFKPISEEEYSDCKNFHKRIKKDIPFMYLISFEEPCKKGFYKAFIAVDNKKGDKDYHFWRQDSNGMWSHKPGTTAVVNVDSDGKLIFNPLLANRKYKYYNYSKPCFFFCTPKNGATPTSRSIHY